METKITDEYTVHAITENHIFAMNGIVKNHVTDIFRIRTNDDPAWLMGYEHMNQIYDYVATRFMTNYPGQDTCDKCDTVLDKECWDKPYSGVSHKYCDKCVLAL